VVQKVYTLLLMFTLHLTISASAQSMPGVPEQYKRLFFQYSDQRKWYERALNSLGLPTQRLGRSYALIAGVTQYPNFPPVQRSLKPAEVDIERLKSYLKSQEFFDEIVVLKDGDMTLDNLDFFLGSYFPSQLAASPHSRFLFAYSGHGYVEEHTDTVRGFLLKSAATSGTDHDNRIELGVVRALLAPVIDSAEKVLVLINSCHSGAFLIRRSFGSNPLGPGERGAYAIMASRASESSLHLDSVGPGSVFFEKVFAALGGVADNAPRDGVVTFHELDTYLHSEIPIVTNGKQNPIEGDISRDGSVGEFFFLNRSRQVQLGNAEVWNPGNVSTFGTQAGDELERGRAAFLDGKMDQALQAFTRAAAAGNSDAMNYVGYLYDNGQGVKQDYEQAKEWYEKAEKAGNSEATNNLGYLYGQGRGVKQDYQQAQEWYEKAASAGNASAMDNLGYLYGHGLGVGQDYQQAKQWYEKGAMAGSAEAMYNLGYLYDKGYGVKQDYLQAKQWYEKAAMAGNAEAVNNLGYLYDKSHGVKQDYLQAKQWYEEAAMAGNAEAFNNLGYLYDKGHGVRQDYRQALRWYEKAAAAGNSDGMNNIAYLYDNGHGIKRDYRQAKQWYEKAAMAGNARAMYHLGYLYEHGHGVTQDYHQARQWYEKAAAAGDIDASKRLRRLGE
jgi:TPR repeat protein